MTSPRVSIALCTYNGARYLRDQLESIASQTLTPHELVACDDASSDATLALLNAFAVAAPFPVHISRNTSTLGATKNFELAISRCSGDLIALADQDDVWLPQKLERLARALDQTGAAYAFCDARLMNEDGAEAGGRTLLGRRFDLRDIEQKYRDGRELDLLLKRDFVYGTTLMFRAELRMVLLPIAASWSHDTWIVNVLALLGHRGVPVLEPLVRYRQHDVQASGGFLAPVPVSYEARVRAYEELRRHLLDLEKTVALENIARLDDKAAYLRALVEVQREGPFGKALTAAREVLSGRWARYSPRTFR